MRSENEHTNKIEDISYKELRALEEIDENPELTQRQLSRKMGVALGVGNLLLKNLAKKGYIKVTHLSWKRWIYVVTPKGMTRKLNLTLAYIESFLGHYRRVRKILKENLNSFDNTIYGNKKMNDFNKNFIKLKDHSTKIFNNKLKEINNE